MRKIEAITIVLAIGMMILSGCSDNGGQKSQTSYTLHPMIPAADSNDTDDNSTDHGNKDEKEDNIPERELNSTKAEQVETIPANWYIRIVVEDTSHAIRSSSAQLGELDESDATARHTLKALAPFGSGYLDVVFRNPEGMEQGDYKSSFQSYAQDARKIWRFVVLSNDANATIRLGWRGIYVLDPYRDTEDRQRYREYRSLHNPLMYRMKLVDTKTGKEVAAAADDMVQYYLFSMDGAHERTFEWIVEPDSVAVKKVQRSVTAVNVKNRSKQLLHQRSQPNKKQQVFDLSHPPEIGIE